jgi:hypothetical protein
MNVFIIGNEGVLIKLTKEDTKLVFDQCLSTKGGFLFVIKMVPALNHVENTVVEPTSEIKTMSYDINKLRNILGQSGGFHLNATAYAYGIKEFGKQEAFESCATSKAKQKKTN